MSDDRTKPASTPAPEEPVVTVAASDEAEEDDASTAKPAKAKRIKKGKRHVPRGRVYITATYNNTIVSFTDAQGNCLSQSSAGRCGFKGSKKSTPYAAGVIVRQAAEKAMTNHGLKDVDVFVRGIGSGRDGAIRALNSQGLSLLSIHDLTPTPHNGCRPKKVRRM